MGALRDRSESAPAEHDDGQAATLLAAIADGSEPALERFYRTYEGVVYTFALRRLGEPADAADVLNETMLEVWRGAGRFEQRARVRTWLLGIAHHKILDRMRRRGRRREDELDPAMPDDEAEPAWASIAAAQDAGRLRACLDRLSDAHREVVHLAFFEDLSYPEIARLVGCPEGTVKTRMFHARRALKRCLVEGPEAAPGGGSE